MAKLLSADLDRVFRSKWFWLCLGGMLMMAVAFIIMQYTAMDYSVPLSRVVFLPMSFYGLAVAALVSLFVGEDFSDGFIRNKIIAGHWRFAVFASNLLVSWLVCILIYLLVTVFTMLIGLFLFACDITPVVFFRHLLMGVGMCLAYGSIFCTITMLCGNKTTSAVLCMGLAFFLLVVCLHTNQVLVQPEYKDGLLNPVYVDGAVRSIYLILHNLNPSGQAAQLSAMHIFDSRFWVFCDMCWIMISGMGVCLFKRKNIK